jgi:hypothetical protein
MGGMADTKSKTTNTAPETAAPEGSAPEEAPAAPKPVPTSRKDLKPGDGLSFTLESGATALMLVTSVVSMDPAEVVGLVLRDSEYPRGLNAYVYDSVEDAQAATHPDAVERRLHAAYWPA